MASVVSFDDRSCKESRNIKKNVNKLLQAPEIKNLITNKQTLKLRSPG